jgi:type I restriction enzyme R subunit
LEYVAQGGTDPDALSTLAGRLARLQREFSTDQLAELRDLAGGKGFAELASDLMKACDPDAQIAKAKEKFATQSPSPEQIKKATAELAQAATTPFMKARFRRRILEISAQNEQTIDRHTIDSVLYSGFDASAVEKAQNKVKDFRKWIEDRKDELTALQVIYVGTRPLKISLKELRKLKDALAAPPLAATPTQLWRAFETAEADAVKGPGGSQLADLVTLVRHAIQPTMLLAPYAAAVRQRYAAWLVENDADAKFTHEQREWLDRMAEHIATSIEIQPDDFQDGWFGQHGSLGRAHALFGDRLTPLLAELNEGLAA